MSDSEENSRSSACGFRRSRSLSPRDESLLSRQLSNLSNLHVSEQQTMAAAHIGSIGEFDPKHDFQTYKKRLEIWMTVNKIKNEDKANVFLAMVGPHAFEVIMNLCTPEDPTTKTYVQLVKMVEDHFQMPRNTVTERLVFRERKFAKYTLILSPRPFFFPC